MFLSVIVPCFNEQEVLPETHRRLTQVLEGVGEDYELLYVNDGSRDGTLPMLRELERADPQVRVLNLSRNFGHQIAVSAGLDHARGRVTVIIDADLQDPPEVMVEMIAKWRDGYDVVYGQRRTRPGENAFKLGSARLFYRLLNVLSDRPIPVDVGDFRLLDRQVVEAMRGMREYDRFLRGMVSWVGFRQCAVPYDRDARFAGVSKYPLMKMLHLAADGILSFSVTPLRAAIILGLLSAAVAFAGIIYAVILRLTTSAWVSGWTLLFVAILFMGGVQLVTAGIIGEYVGRIYREVKGRPLYLLASDDTAPRDRQPPARP